MGVLSWIVVGGLAGVIAGIITGKPPLKKRLQSPRCGNAQDARCPSCSRQDGGSPCGRDKRDRHSTRPALTGGAALVAARVAKVARVNRSRSWR